MNTKTGRQGGFTILEGLIAVVIFAVGMIALATFQGGIMSESGEVKARNEAVVLAQDKADELRAMIVRGDFDANVATGTDTVNGNNAAFTRDWTISDSTTPEYKLVEVAVAWTDPDGDAQVANMDTLIAWNDPRAGITQTGLLNTGRTITEPSGGERNPGAVYDEMPGGAIDLGDGFSIYARGDDTTHLIRNERTDTDGDGDIDSDDGYETVLEVYSAGVVMLRGVIELIPGTVTTTEELTAEVLALTSDAGFCVYPEPADFSLLPQAAEGQPTVSDNFFHCYVGENWYGNLGVTGANRLDSVCPLIYSYDPVIATSQLTNLITATSVNGNPVGTDRYGTALVSVLPNQDFVLVRLQGSDTCESFATQSPIASIRGTLMLTSGATSLGANTRIEATPDVDCPISGSDPGPYTFRCDVDTGETGWDGTVRLIPDATRGVCGDNAWSLPEGSLLTGGDVVDGSTQPAGPSFELTELDAAPEGCVGSYEYTITVQAAQVGPGNGVANEIIPEIAAVTGILEPDSWACVVSSVSKNEREAVWRCGVLAQPGMTLSLGATLEGHTVTSVPPFTLPAAPGADGEEWDFSVDLDQVITID